jgi:hypothetical protein
MKTYKKVKKVQLPKKIKKKQPKTTVPDRCCCEKKAAREILARNMQGDPKLNIHSESSEFLFAEKFLISLLREQDETENLPSAPTQEAAPEDFTPEKNQEDFSNSLEKGTDQGQFDVEGISADVTMETIKKVKEWAIKLNEFEKFLNNPSESSLHRILADNDRAGSLLRGITRKASDSITRIAGEIAKLKEVLNTFVNTAPKKLRDTQDIRGPVQ